MVRTVQQITLTVIFRIFIVKARRPKIVKNYFKNPSCVIDHECHIPTNYFAMYQ